MQSAIDENSNRPTEDLIMEVTASRFEHHPWTIAAFEKILEKRNLPFNIYTEDFFKKKITEKFSTYYPGWGVGVARMMLELIENGWDLSIPITAKDYHESFNCYITTENVTLHDIVEKHCAIINAKCPNCGDSTLESDSNSEGVCDKCHADYIKNYR